MYIIYSEIIKQNINRVCVFFSSTYKVQMHDVSNVHVKSFYLHYIRIFKCLEEQSNVHQLVLSFSGKNKLKHSFIAYMWPSSDP